MEFSDLLEVLSGSVWAKGSLREPCSAVLIGRRTVWLELPHMHWHPSLKAEGHGAVPVQGKAVDVSSFE